MGSGEDIVAGRTTGAESTTSLLGAIPSELDVGFNGDAILIVGPHPAPLNPKGVVDGIRSSGSSPKSGVAGTGLAGKGGTVAGAQNGGGTGVEASGGSNGGTGVEASGGDGSQKGNGPIGGPGVGLKAQGGKFHVVSPTSGSAREASGPGVVAAAGQTDMPGSSVTGSVGVWGQGGDEVSQAVNVLGGIATLGPDFAGPGVIGRGGRRRSNNGKPNESVVIVEGGGCGVVGIAGGASPPAPADQKNAGVLGVSAFGNGGVFIANNLAQLHLKPIPKDPNSRPTIPGKPGDLLATAATTPGGKPIAILWFRVVDLDGGWVQLSPLPPGLADM